MAMGRESDLPGDWRLEGTEWRTGKYGAEIKVHICKGSNPELKFVSDWIQYPYHSDFTPIPNSLIERAKTYQRNCNAP